MVPPPWAGANAPTAVDPAAAAMAQGQVQQGPGGMAGAGGGNAAAAGGGGVGASGAAGRVSEGGGGPGLKSEADLKAAWGY